MTRKIFNVDIIAFSIEYIYNNEYFIRQMIFLYHFLLFYP